MQELEKILEELKRIKDGNRKEKLYAKYPPNSKDQEVLNAYSQGYEDGTDNFYNAAVQIIRNHMNNDWFSVEERLPEDGTDVLVVLKPTYESDYIEYSIARYLRFENDEDHWCDNHYGYLEWDKYSDGRGGSSQYKVIAWQPIAPYRPERSDNHDAERSDYNFRKEKGIFRKNYR